MKQIKVRNIGNSVGIILPKELGLINGDIIQAEKKGNLFILDTSKVAREKLTLNNFDNMVEDSLSLGEKIIRSKK